MKIINFTSVAFLFLILGGCSLFSQTAKNWTQDELLEPSLLANVLNDPKQENPLIFNIGPLSNIKGAIEIGPTKDKVYLNKLRQSLAKVPKDKMVIIYCGCCPFRNCPNVRPAFALLKEMKFTKPRLLNLPQNLKVDWIEPGYPMD